MLDDRPMESIPSSAVGSWADFAPVDGGGSTLLTLVLIFIQLVGLIALGSGVLKIMRFVSPGHPKAPPTLGLPIFQALVGLFALVPDRVYALAIDALQQMGWM